jgi:hypothetical protein
MYPTHLPQHIKQRISIAQIIPVLSCQITRLLQDDVHFAHVAAWRVQLPIERAF